MAKPTVISNFYAQIPRRPYGCWEWNGSKNEKGYGTLKYNKKNWLAHRFSWKHVNGDIPKGILVLHRCDNPSCVNTEHLFLGTNQDNMADMVRKGRQSPRKGEHHGKAKLTEEQVKRIRQDGRTQKEIATDYGMTSKHIGRIKRRELWSHIQ